MAENKNTGDGNRTPFSGGLWGPSHLSHTGVEKFAEAIMSIAAGQQNKGKKAGGSKAGGKAKSKEEKGLAQQKAVMEAIREMMRAEKDLQRTPAEKAIQDQFGNPKSQYAPDIEAPSRQGRGIEPSRFDNDLAPTARDEYQSQPDVMRASDFAQMGPFALEAMPTYAQAMRAAESIPQMIDQERFNQPGIPQQQQTRGMEARGVSRAGITNRGAGTIAGSTVQGSLSDYGVGADRANRGMTGQVSDMSRGFFDALSDLSPVGDIGAKGSGRGHGIPAGNTQVDIDAGRFDQQNPERGVTTRGMSPMNVDFEQEYGVVNPNRDVTNPAVPNVERDRAAKEREAIDKMKAWEAPMEKNPLRTEIYAAPQFMVPDIEKVPLPTKRPEMVVPVPTMRPERHTVVDLEEQGDVGQKGVYSGAPNKGLSPGHTQTSTGSFGSKADLEAAGVHGVGSQHTNAAGITSSFDNAGGTDTSDAADSTVLCTYYNRKGWLPDDVYAADSLYGATSPEWLVDWYHSWAVPLAGILPDHPVLEAVIWPAVKLWAHSMKWSFDREAQHGHSR